MAMTKRDRLRAALTGDPVDRVPVAFWRHWPIDDQDADALASRTLEYQAKFDWDFIKVTPSSTYSIDGYGGIHVYDGKPIGDRTYRQRAVQRVEDWDRIQPLDITEGAYGRQLRCLRMVLERRDPNTPVIQTIFNPLRMAGYLAGDQTLLVHLRRDPERVEWALRALTQTCVSFVRAVMAEGADGIFLSTSAASYESMTIDEYRRFGRLGDVAVFETAKDGWLNILHIHGQNPMFAELADYPVQAVNWHDRTAWPSLSKGAALFPGAVVGGVEQYEVLHFGTPDDVVAQVDDAIAQMEGRRLIVAAGCTYPLTVPEGNLLAARRAVGKVVAKKKAEWGRIDREGST